MNEPLRRDSTHMQEGRLASKKLSLLHWEALLTISKGVNKTFHGILNRYLLPIQEEDGQSFHFYTNCFK
jgi:hypothetical protein